jgi:hypothetical protein
MHNPYKNDRAKHTGTSKRDRSEQSLSEIEMLQEYYEEATNRMMYRKVRRSKKHHREE